MTLEKRLILRGHSSKYDDVEVDVIWNPVAFVDASAPKITCFQPCLLFTGKDECVAHSSNIHEHVPWSDLLLFFMVIQFTTRNHIFRVVTQMELFADEFLVGGTGRNLRNILRISEFCFLLSYQTASAWAVEESADYHVHPESTYGSGTAQTNRPFHPLVDYSIFLAHMYSWYMYFLFLLFPSLSFPFHSGGAGWSSPCRPNTTSSHWHWLYHW